MDEKRITAFAVALREDARHISSMLGRLPTDPQIIEAAQHAVQGVLLMLFMGHRPGEPINLPEMASGFISIVTCTPKGAIAKIVPIRPRTSKGCFRKGSREPLPTAWAST